MGIALTIGIMIVIFGVINYVQKNGPYTILDDIEPGLYIILGVIVLINCFVHYLIS
jgi:hypothetical protein